MSYSRQILSALLLVSGLLPLCSGCAGDGRTERVDYTYDRPIWTDASYERPSNKSAR